MQYSVKKTELEECYEEGMILQLEEDETLVIKSDEVREIIRAVIWRIGMDEGGQILHYNDWIDDNWKDLINKLEETKNAKKDEINQEVNKMMYQRLTAKEWRQFEELGAKANWIQKTRMNQILEADLKKRRFSQYQ